MADHPIFAKYRRQAPSIDDTYRVSFFGVKTRQEFEIDLGAGMLTSGEAHETGAAVDLPSPKYEDYYEWIDLLEAIDQAGDSFTMIELGAGYGRWIANGYFAAARHRDGRRRTLTLIAAEADARRFEWMRQHLGDNNIAVDPRHLLQLAVAEHHGFSLFPLSSVYRYGDALAAIDSATAEGLQERLAQLYQDGVRACSIPGEPHPYQITRLVPASDIIALAEGVVDVVHMDIQGAEVGAIQGSIACINEKVKRMHIGTHSPEIEDSLYRLLVANGWAIKRFYPGLTDCHAEYGLFMPRDGIISCVNSRFAAE
jgi:FkbM family methyltransferase